MQTRTVALETWLSLREAAQVLTEAFAVMKARVEHLDARPDPVAQLDGVADIALVGQRSTMVNTWAVQVYLYELGDRRGVELVAVGDGMSRRARGRTRGAVSLAKSVQRLDSLVDELRSCDARAQVIG